MIFHKIRQDKQKGFSLIEALVVMIVGIVILAAAAAGIGRLFRTSEITTEVGNITQMAANLRNLRNGADGYRKLDTAAAVRFKAIPTAMRQDTEHGYVLNVWGGEVLIRPDPDGDQAFTILYTQVPSEACGQLSLKLRDAGWSRMSVGSTPITRTSSLEDISRACKHGHATLNFVSG